MLELHTAAGHELELHLQQPWRAGARPQLLVQLKLAQLKLVLHKLPFQCALQYEQPPDPRHDLATALVGNYQSK
jgi:hypothetical protein